MGHRSALFSFFADNVSAEIRDDYFAKIVKKNVGFFDVTKMGQISKFDSLLTGYSLEAN